MKNQFEDRETGVEVRMNGCIEVVSGNERRYVDYESCFEKKKRFKGLKEADNEIYDVNFVQINERVVNRVFIIRITGKKLRNFLPRTYQSFYLERERKEEGK